MKTCPIIPCCVNRCEKERERRGSLEEELSKLWLVEEELQNYTLLELENLLDNQTQQLMELQINHQQVKL